MKKLLFILSLFITTTAIAQGRRDTLIINGGGGGSSVDLSNYFTKHQIDSLLALGYTKIQVDSIATQLRSEMGGGGNWTRSSNNIRPTITSDTVSIGGFNYPIMHSLGANYAGQLNVGGRLVLVGNSSASNMLIGDTTAYSGGFKKNANITFMSRESDNINSGVIGGILSYQEDTLGEHSNNRLTGRIVFESQDFEDTATLNNTYPIMYKGNHIVLGSRTSTPTISGSSPTVTINEWKGSHRPLVIQDKSGIYTWVQFDSSGNTSFGSRSNNGIGLVQVYGKLTVSDYSVGVASDSVLVVHNSEIKKVARNTFSGGGIGSNVDSLGGIPAGNYLLKSDSTLANRITVNTTNIGTNTTAINSLKLGADSLKHLFVDTSSHNNGNVLAFDSINHKWYLTPNGTGGGGGGSYTASLPIKILSNNILADTSTANTGLTTLYQSSLKANDNAVMHLSGNETATNTKSFNQIKFTSGANNVMMSTGYAFISAGSAESTVGATAGTNNMNIAGKLGVALNVNGTRILNATPVGVAVQNSASYQTPDSSAILDVLSSTQGVRFPVMTTSAKNNISNPVSGLLVNDTTLKKPSWRFNNLWYQPVWTGDSIPVELLRGTIDKSKLPATKVYTSVGIGSINDSTIRLAAHVYSQASTSILTINADTTDVAVLTAQAASLTIANPTGSPLEAQVLKIRIKDNGTGQTISFGTQFRFSPDLAAPTTTIAGKTLYMEFWRNNTDAKWDMIILRNNF